MAAGAGTNTMDATTIIIIIIIIIIMPAAVRAKRKDALLGICCR
jgi:hypothetical protein